MDNAEEILQALEEFSKLKPKEIPKELDEYLGYVAKSGDPVYQWHLVKHLFHEKLSNVITEFYETSPTIDLPPCPNVDPFNYDRMKTSLLERLDSFTSAPFTIQRICELLTNPRKQYNRVDKFMRAIEKNILVVSTREPGVGKRLENDQTEAVLNGIPESKINEERIVSVCSDNVQFNNSTDSSQVPVENAVNACIIQEQIEIVNSASSTGVSGETRNWCEVNSESDKKDIDNIVKTDSIVESAEINVVSTSSISPPISNSELSNSNVLFSENDSEIKPNKSENSEDPSIDSVICNEPIVSSTPDSPDSPEPSNSDETCEPSTDENNLQPIKLDTEKSSIDSENVNINSINDDILDAEEQEEKKLLETENADEIIESTSNSDDVEETLHVSEEMSVIHSDDLPQRDVCEEKIVELKIEHLLPENVQQPDSSNDSCHSVEDNSRESTVNVHVESAFVLGKDIIEESEDISNNSEVSSEQTISPEVVDVTSSQASVTIQEEEESVINGGREVEDSNEEIIVKEIVEEDDESVDSHKSEEVKESVEICEENLVMTAGDEAVASSDECISIEDVSVVKDVEEASNTQSEVVESTNEILGELCEPERREGSIIHVTPNVVGAEQSNNIVEDICVDQSSCGAEEQEAMDVDETSNQPMIMSEGETEGEPMDQSEQLLS